MKYFAGLDVALEETAIFIVDEDGRIIKPFDGLGSRCGLRAGGSFGRVIGAGASL